jgi:hypothetical protein
MGTPMVFERGRPFSERMRQRAAWGRGRQSQHISNYCMQLSGSLVALRHLENARTHPRPQLQSAILEHMQLHWHHAVAGAHEMMRTNERVVSKFQLLDLVKPGTS